MSNRTAQHVAQEVIAARDKRIAELEIRLAESEELESCTASAYWTEIGDQEYGYDLLGEFKDACVAIQSSASEVLKMFAKDARRERKNQRKLGKRIVELEAECQTKGAELWDTTKRAEKAEARVAELEGLSDETA